MKQIINELHEHELEYEEAASTDRWQGRPPPTAEQWARFPRWLKMEIVLICAWYTFWTSYKLMISKSRQRL
jgi:hypothetical protein